MFWKWLNSFCVWCLSLALCNWSSRMLRCFRKFFLHFISGSRGKERLWTRGNCCVDAVVVVVVWWNYNNCDQWSEGTEGKNVCIPQYGCSSKWNVYLQVISYWTLWEKYTQIKRIHGSDVAHGHDEHPRYFWSISALCIWSGLLGLLENCRVTHSHCDVYNGNGCL